MPKPFFLVVLLFAICLALPAFAEFKFAAYGDSRTGTSIHADIVSMIMADNVDLVIHTGDFVGDGGSWSQWQSQFLNIAGPLLNHAPSPGLTTFFYPSIGNHEVSGSGWSTNYFNVFNVSPVNQYYYSFDYQNAHFVSLYVTSTWAPSEFDSGSAQYQWLSNDLAQASADPSIKWKFVFFHAPVFSCVATHACGRNIQEHLVPLFDQYDVTAVFGGDDHSYQRIGPIKDYLSDPVGTTYIITAGGGASLYSFYGTTNCNLHEGRTDMPCDPSWTGMPNQAFPLEAGESVNHYMRFTVRDDAVVGEAVRRDGTIIETFNLQNEVVAQAFFVDKENSGCNDSNPGTEAQPWCTIGKASQTLQAGETVLIREGTYNEEDLQPANNGQPGQFITFAGYPGENVHIKGSWNGGGDTRNCFRMNNASYIRITGVEISNYKRCIYLESANDNIVVDNVQVHDCIMGYSARGDSSNLTVKDSDFYRISDPVASHDDGHAGVELVGGSNIEITNVRSFDNDDGLGPSGDADGFSSKWVDNLTFTNCTANDNSEDGFDLAGSNVKLINCKAYNVGVNGLKTWRRTRDDVLLPSDFTVINFITSGNGENGISASNGPDISIYNSVIYNNGAQGIRFLDATSGDQPEAILYNNILMGNGFYSPVDDTSGYIAFYVGSNWNVTSNYNIYYNNDRDNQAYSGEGPNSLLNSNPEFVSPEEKNFRLLSTSPAIDRGTSVSAIFDYDFEETYRPQGSGWDIGAYELNGGTPDPECTGTDTSCGTWPSCQNCNTQDGCSGDSYRDYRCSGTSCTYTEDNCTDCSCSCGGYNTTESIANNNCFDGKDNDCDSLTDAADTGCEQPQTCGNGQIDDGENCENCPQDIQCPSEEICCAAACTTPECSEDNECQTGQTCNQPGTCNAACIDCNITCSNDTECDDQDPETTDTCENPGTCESFCRNEPVTCGGTTCTTGQICCNQTCTTPACNSTTECNDQDQCTRDYCSQAGTCNAQCSNTEIPKCGWKNMTWVLPSCFPIDSTFQVTVTDETGSPLQDVTIEYGTQTETTDATGKTELIGEKNKYFITANKEGYHPLNGKKIATTTCNPTYTTTNGKPPTTGREKINIEIIDTPYIGKQFTLKITDKDGNPIQGATIEYSNQTVTTDQTGQAELQGEKAKYLITATAPQGKETTKILPKTYVEETTDQNVSGQGTEQPFALPLDIIALVIIIIVGGFVLLRTMGPKKGSSK